MRNWKKIIGNIGGVLIGVAGIIHALPPAIVEQVHVPELLAAIAALIGLYQRAPKDE